MEGLRPVVLALLIGGAGALVAHWLNFPAPALTGPALCVTIAALAGLRLSIPDAIRNACFLIIGMTMGTGVTPETVATAAQWPLSIIILLIMLVAIMAVSAWVLERLFSYERATALLAAAPGHLSYVLGLSTAMKVDVPAISIIQSTRVLMLTLAVPFVAVAITDGTPATILPSGASMTPLVLVMTALGGVAAALAVHCFRIPAAYLLGGMLASSVGHLTEVGPGLIPVWLSVPAFVMMGTMIGTRFSGVSLAVLKRASKAALVVTAIAGVVAILTGFFAAMLLGLPLIQLLVAFAPGGLETMAAMALLLAVNPAFVAAHHVIRIVFLTLIIPIALHGAQQSGTGVKS